MVIYRRRTWPVRYIPYTGSKAALEGMARPLAAELAHHEITVNVIDPGAIDTRCWA